MSFWMGRLLVIVLLVIVAAFLSASGSAVVSVRRSRLRELVDRGNARAKRVLQLLDDSTKLCAAAEIGVFVLNVIIAALIVLSFLPGLQTAFVLSGLPTSSAAILGLVILAVLTGVGLAVFVDLAPRALASASAERFALVSTQALSWVSRGLSPLIWLVQAGGNLLVKPFGVTCRLGASGRSEEELKILVEAVEDEGAIEEEERDMIDSIFEFNDTLVRQVMVPRVDMRACDVDSPLGELIDAVLEYGHSRIPVYQGTVDTVAGIIHAKDLLRALRETRDADFDLNAILRPAMFVPENKMVSDLLQDFREQKQQMAIVRDEFGGTAGLVTVEDLLEEIVGEIQDEYDQEEPLVVVGEDGRILVHARMAIDDLNEDLDLGLPEGEYETIGGFVFGLHGKEPEIGDSVRYNGFVLTVTEKDDRRLSQILIERSPEHSPEVEDAQAVSQSSAPQDSGNQSASG
ncbi:MAG: HlyC/CorC family transporter [Armatimonadetes bacterium]|nr:HlyC/CorC family transporter [Armatimonadota bacterium]